MSKQPLPKHVVLDHATNLPTCTRHNRPLVFRPPGVSKRTNKPYKGFYSCGIKDELGFCDSTIQTWQVDLLPVI